MRRCGSRSRHCAAGAISLHLPTYVHPGSSFFFLSFLIFFPPPSVCFTFLMAAKWQPTFSFPLLGPSICYRGLISFISFPPPFFAFSIRTEWGGTKKGIRLPFRSATSPVERSRFAKLPAGERTQDLAGPVGLPSSQRPVLYGARPTQKEQHHSQENQQQCGGSGGGGGCGVVGLL